MNKLPSRALWLACSALLMTASYWSARFALADWEFQQNTSESLSTAVHLAAGSASYHSLLAEHMEAAGVDPASELLKAAQLSPFDSAFLIRLGFQAEVRGDYHSAEQYLLRAASVDHMFAPRSALMNFYFRNQKIVEFWDWTRKSLEMSYGDRWPIYKLMWYVTENAQEIEHRLPSNTEILRSYLVFLTLNHPDAGPSIALRLASVAGASDVPVLIQYCDRVIQTHPPTARAVWNKLCLNKLLPYLPVEPASGDIVTNGNFSVPPIQQVFDWRIPYVEGVISSATSDGEGFIAELSGSQPQEAPLIYQIMPVQQNSVYEISFAMRLTSGHVNGVKWLIYDEHDGVHPAYASQELEPAADWKTSHFHFTKVDGGVAKLVLQYHREPGTTLAEGALAIRGVSGHRVP